MRARLRSPRASLRRAALERSLVWMLGSPRSGSTWLLNLLAAHPSVAPLDEPLLGGHLGAATTPAIGTALGQAVPPTLHALQRGRPSYFFSDEFAPVWQPLL